MTYASNLTPVQVAQLLEDAREGRKSETPSSEEVEDIFAVDASAVDVEGYTGPSMAPQLARDQLLDVYHAALFLH